jgi:hypothetical protein
LTVVDAELDKRLGGVEFEILIERIDDDEGFRGKSESGFGEDG